MSKNHGLLRLLPLAAALASAAPAARAALAAETRQAGGSHMTLTLEAAIRTALEHAPEVGVAQSSAARAEAVLDETRALNRPQIMTGTGLAYNNGFPLSIEGAAPSLFQVAVTQPVLSARNSNLIREAEASLKASRLAPEGTRNDVAARIAVVYDELHRARKLEGLWASRADASRRSVDAIEALAEAGKARPVDLTLARLAVAATEQQLLAVRERIGLADLELRERLRLPPGASIRTEEPRLDLQTLEQPVDTLYRRALEVHPEIRQGELNLSAREFHVEAERGEARPRLELVTEYALFSRHNNYSDYFSRFSRHNYLLGLSVQVPIWSGGRTGARVAESRSDVAEARFRLVRQKSDLRLGLERSASQLRIARGAAEVARLDAAAAAESLKVQESLFEAGRAGVRDLEVARGSTHEKAVAALEAERLVWQSQVELLRVSGTLGALYSPK